MSKLQRQLKAIIEEQTKLRCEQIAKYMRMKNSIYSNPTYTFVKDGANNYSIKKFSSDAIYRNYTHTLEYGEQMNKFFNNIIYKNLKNG